MTSPNLLQCRLWSKWHGGPTLPAVFTCAKARRLLGWQARYDANADTAPA